MEERLKNIISEEAENLTEMTINGASNDEIAEAIKNSMVVIDSEKQNIKIEN